MPFDACEMEAHVLAAARAGGGDAGHAAHLATCESCALAVASDLWLRAAAAELTPVALPAPGTLVLRAQMRARRDAAERSLQPLEIWRLAVWALAGTMIAVGLAERSSFVAGMWSSSTTPAQALFAGGAVILAALPIWFRLRRDAA